jgi:amino acid permease
MGVEFQSVITMANSIIGVSVLAMPFCFKQVSRVQILCSALKL